MRIIFYKFLRTKNLGYKITEKRAVQEPKVDSKSTFIGSKGSEIKCMIVDLSDYESEDFDSNYEKYITGVREN